MPPTTPPTVLVTPATTPPTVSVTPPTTPVPAPATASAVAPTAPLTAFPAPLETPPAAPVVPSTAEVPVAAPPSEASVSTGPGTSVACVGTVFGMPLADRRTPRASAGSAVATVPASTRTDDA